EHGFPLRVGLAVLLQRGAPPQATLVLPVLPEVVVVVADLLHAGDLGVRVEDGEDLGLELPEFRSAGDLGFRLGIARLHPVQGLLVLHLFQPGVGVVVGGRLRGGAGGDGEAGDQAGTGELGHGALRDRRWTRNASTGPPPARCAGMPSESTLRPPGPAAPGGARGPGAGPARDAGAAGVPPPPAAGTRAGSTTPPAACRPATAAASPAIANSRVRPGPAGWPGCRGSRLGGGRHRGGRGSWRR